jgi:osmotically-inducible protein OsmY
MTNDDLRRDVTAELDWDPRVDSTAIEVSAAGGVVTLRGTAASLRHKRSAGDAAARVRGVIRVADELAVRIPDRDRHDDEDLCGDVLEALMLESAVPMTVDAQARDGVVTLTGTVEWHYQRQAAESRAASVPGVAGVDNAITLAPAPAAPAVAHAISCAFRRDAVLDAERLSVETCPGGQAILSGTVSSRVARDRAVAAVWSAAGVVDVDDRIVVEYSS